MKAIFTLIFLSLIFDLVFSQNNNSLHFSGANQNFVTMNGLSDHLDGNTNFTVEMWFRIDETWNAPESHSLFAINRIPHHWNGLLIFYNVGQNVIEIIDAHSTGTSHNTHL